MSQQEKNNVLSLITTLIISIPYYIYVLANYDSANLNSTEAFKYWAAAILWLIPIRIVTEIVIHIIAAIIEAIVTKKDDFATIIDERDKLISLKATRNSYYTFMISFLAGIATLYIYDKPETFFITLIIGGFFSELCEYISKIYYYRRG